MLLLQDIYLKWENRGIWRLVEINEETKLMLKEIKKIQKDLEIGKGLL